jgi:hypothetical protein
MNIEQNPDDTNFTVNDSMLNEETVNQFRLSMDPNAIPDLGEMLNVINDLLAFIETDYMAKLEMENKKDFEKLVYSKYNGYLPMKVIKLMLDPDKYEHLSRLLDMFDSLNDVKHGRKNIQDAYDNFNEKLNEREIVHMQRKRKQRQKQRQ